MSEGSCSKSHVERVMLKGLSRVGHNACVMREACFVGHVARVLVQ